MGKPVLKYRHPKTVDQIFDEILAHAKKGPIKVRSLLNILSGKGEPLILVFLSLPFCFSLEIPGMSTPIGIIIALISLKLAVGKILFAPKFLLEKKVPPASIRKWIHRGSKLLKKIRIFTHPRLSFICDHPVFHFINVCLLVFLGFFLALPLPIPLTNLIPGWSIFLISLGLLKDDGLFVLGSYTILTTVILLIIFK